MSGIQTRAGHFPMCASPQKSARRPASPHDNISPPTALYPITPSKLLNRRTPMNTRILVAALITASVSAALALAAPAPTPTPAAAPTPPASAAASAPARGPRPPSTVRDPLAPGYVKATELPD